MPFRFLFHLAYNCLVGMADVAPGLFVYVFFFSSVFFENSNSVVVELIVIIVILSYGFVRRFVLTVAKNIKND